MYNNKYFKNRHIKLKLSTPQIDANELHNPLVKAGLIKRFRNAF